MNQQTMVLDVREDIRSGIPPCSRIMESARQLSAGDILRLIAPFEPVPLYDVLGREGFVHVSRRLGGGDWEVDFTRRTNRVSITATHPTGFSTACGCGCSAAEVIQLDVRGLEPPQPMMRVLETLAALPDDATLQAITDRRPIHLLDQLEARGFIGESEEHSQGGHITHIRRR